MGLSLYIVTFYNQTAYHMKLKYIFIPVIAAGSVLAISSIVSSCVHDSYRAKLDDYIAIETEAVFKAHLMKPGLSVYVDFSDGMNAAYSPELSRQALQRMVNTFTDTKGKTSFFSLSDNKITPLSLSQTEIYNAILSGANYTKTMAPIEETLKQIVSKNQAAILISDFEEYNGGIIQQQAYAKDYFKEWLQKGFNITFYKIDYKEGAKDKHLYFTIFDSPLNNLSQQVETSLGNLLNQGIEKFAINAPDASFEFASSYPSAHQGGNYFGSNGEDLISGVVSDGSKEAFFSYSSEPLYRDNPAPGIAYGAFTQYYPFGVDYTNIPTNISDINENPDEKNKFSHLISKIYVNFTNQQAYDIQGIAVSALDFEPVMAAFADWQANVDENGNRGKFAPPAATEIKDLFSVTLQPSGKEKGWNEILFDFDPKFKGTLPPGMDSEKDLLKADIIISNATPRIEAANRFFSWTGNQSLSQSVINVLNDPQINPIGHPVVTYYIKVL